MEKFKWLVLVLMFLAIVLGPVAVTQAKGQAKSRTYHNAGLSSMHYVDVAFRNEAQDINLAGMLFVPDGTGPFPAVVMIHGSGTSRRNNTWYLTVANYLQENGVLVLLPDKRGSEKSEGNWRTSSYEDLATDTVAAVNFLKNHNMVDVSKVGIIGMSQGGHFSPVVAAQSSDVAFLVSVVGTSLTSYDVLHYEETHNLREMGFLPGVSDLIAYPSTWVLRNITQKDFWSAVGNFDPLPYWKQVTIPALVMQGSEDTNVPTEASKARLVALNKSNVEVKIYEGSGHALQDPPGMGDSIFREEALTDIKNFIDAVMSSDN